MAADAQAGSMRCECGQRQIVTPTLNPYDFAYRCPGCGRAGFISWTRTGPEPLFCPDIPSDQRTLF